MIYFDNAATTAPKPRMVTEAVTNAMTQLSANPGRSGHDLSVKTADMVYSCRSEIADFFHFAHPERVVFTSNCTESINFVIKGLQLTGGHVVTSSLEHNAVMRPLYKIKRQGVGLDVAEVFIGNNAATLRSFERLITDNTRLVICTHASNVCGAVLPIEKIGALCHDRGVLFAVDAAQSAGVFPIDMEAMNIDFLCLPGHKGLYGPMGTGVLLCAKDLDNTLIEGGTGNKSISFEQPDELPERLESGTINVPGIAGLKAGITFVKSKGIETIYNHEMNLASMMYRGLKGIRKVRLYTAEPIKGLFAPVICFNIDGMSSVVAAEKLNAAGFAVRPGLHCAPAAHRRLGTIEFGAIRVSFSAFNKPAEVTHFLNFIKKM